MKRLFLTLAFALFLPFLVSAQQQQIPTLKPFKELPAETPTPLARRDKWGFADAKGKFVIKPVFDAVEPFKTVTAQNVSIDVAKVRVGDKWGFITTEHVYLFPPEYDDVTDFDEGGVAVGTAGAEKSLLGTVPAMSAKGTFWTLSGIVRISGLSDVSEFMPSGIGWAAVDGKWGLLSRGGFWKLAAQYDDWSNCREGLFYVKKDGKTGLVAADGKVLLEPAADELSWNEVRNRFTAVLDGKYGEYEPDGAMRYPCIFDALPVESAAGYVEMWDGETPCLFMPGDRKYTAAEYDAKLFGDMSYGDYVRSAALPDWLKLHLDKGTDLVSITSDLPEFKTFGPEEGDSLVFPTVVLASGDTLERVMSALLDGDLSCLAEEEPLRYCDRGAYLYYIRHTAEDYYTVSIVDLEDLSETKVPVCGNFLLREKEGVIASGGTLRKGANPVLYPALIKVVGAQEVPVLRYEFHEWAGERIVTIGHNVPPQKGEDADEGWNHKVAPGMMFPLGDYFYGDEAGFEDLSLKVNTPNAASGIAIYEIIRHPDTIAYGLVGLDHSFFTQALFEGLRWNGNDLEVKIPGGLSGGDGGSWQTVSLSDLQSLDPFVQP